VEPILGELSTLNLKSIPKVTALISEIVNNEINNLTYPKKLPMEVPCVSEPIKIDKHGNII
jgi:hypothetical protein